MAEETDVIKETDKVMVRLDDLTEHPGNTRIHPTQQIRELRRSLNTFGQFRNIVVDEQNVILIGHGIVRAMKDEGWTEADAYRMSGMSETEKKKMLLTDNKTQGMGREDFSAVEALIRDINDSDIPGFDDTALKAILLETQEATKEVEDFIDQEYVDTFTRDPRGGVDETSEGEIGVLEQGSQEPAENFPAGEIIGHLPQTKTRIEYNKRLVCPHCQKEVWV